MDPNIQANWLAIEQLKAGQAELNDRMDLMKKDMSEGFKNLEFLITAKNATDQQTVQPTLPTPQPQQQQQPQHQQSYRQSYPSRYGPNPLRNGPRRVVPGLTGGPGYQVPYNQQFRPRPPSRNADLPPAAPNVASAPPASELGAAAAPPQQPQHSESMMHPRADPRQNAYEHHDIWAEHLEYEPTPMNYAAFGAASGNYSYYPPDFQ